MSPASPVLENDVPTMMLYMLYTRENLVESGRRICLLYPVRGKRESGGLPFNEVN